MRFSLKKYFPLIIALGLHLIALILFQFKTGALESNINTQLNNASAAPIEFNLKKHHSFNFKPKPAFAKVTTNEKPTTPSSVPTQSSTQPETSHSATPYGNGEKNVNLDQKSAGEIKSLFSYIELPPYPKMARMNNIEGKVRVKIKFFDGQIKNVEILESSKQPMLDKSVLDSVSKWSLKEKASFEFTKTFVFKLN
jgi:TonB family protein